MGLCGPTTIWKIIAKSMLFRNIVLTEYDCMSKITFAEVNCNKYYASLIILWKPSNRLQLKHYILISAALVITIFLINILCFRS